MASTATTRLGLRKQGTGDNEDTWGTELNEDVIDLTDEAIAGVETVSLTGNKTLSSTNYVANEARNAVLRLTDGGLSAAPTITIPAVEKPYVVHNTTTYVITFASGGTDATVPASRWALVYCDGTDVYSRTLFEAGDQSTYGGGYLYSFSTTTTDADPGAGVLRLDNATPASATGIYIDDAESGGTDISALMLTWDDSGSTVKGHMKIQSVSTPATFHIYAVSALTDNSGYMDFTVTYVDGSGSFANNDQVIVSFSRTGDKGEPTTVSGTANEITVTYVGADPTISLPSALTFTGKTVTGGTFDTPKLKNQISFDDSGTTYAVLTNPAQNVLQFQGQGNSRTTAIHINPGSGTQPTDTICEFVLHRTEAQAFGGDYGRVSLTQLGSASSYVMGLYIEYGGTVTPGPFIVNLGIENPATTFTSYEFLRHVTDGADIGNTQYGATATSARDILQMEIANIGSTGTRDSHAIKWRGKANDGTERAVDWRAYGDVTSNAGAGSWTLQYNLNGGGWSTQLAVSSAGVLTGPTSVGIGVAPNYTMTVYQSGNSLIQLVNSSTGTTAVDGGYFGFASDTVFRVNNQEANALWLMTGGARGFVVNYTASSVNWGGVDPTATGTAVTFYATGGDATVGLRLAPKSTGDVTVALTSGGEFIIDNIPTSSAGLATGSVWSNSGVLNIV